MPFCLPKDLATTFKQKLKSGEITPEKLTKMTSEERNAFFSDFLGKQNAKEINAAFESKLLLKNQQQGIITWAKRAAGLKPEVRRDFISRVEKMQNILQPKELDSFLGDLVEKKLGVDVTPGEAGKIAELSKRIQDTKAAMATGGDRLDYGRAKVEFYNYVNDLKLAAEKKTIKEMLQTPVQTISELGGSAKAIKASMDNSAIFRQGWKTLMTNPKIWLQNATKSFSDIVRTVGGKNVINELNADIISRPNYDLMQKAKLAVGTVEEAFPVSWPEKVPAIGRLYKASQDAYTAFVHKVRADVFDKYIDIAKRSGVDINDKFQLESIGKLVNSLTGRGHLGRLEPIANVVNNVFFSPRFVKSQFDTLTLHAADKFSWFARKQAAKNLLKMVSGAAATLAIADAILPGSVEKDPRSSDFGKIRIGDTRFDVTGGLSPLVTLASRLITKTSKSSTSGVVKPIDSGEFGAMTSGDLVADFFSNKLSPLYSMVKNLATDTAFGGEKPTLAGELGGLFVPLPILNYAEIKDNPNAANNLLIVIADALGISTNTYSKPLTEAEKLYEELKDLSPEEANEKVDSLTKDNPQLYDDLAKVAEENKLGITPKDKYMKTLGVKNGERANYIWDELSRLKSPEEKNAYLEELNEKKIITDTVYDQIQQIKDSGGDLIERAKKAKSAKSMAEVAGLYIEAFGIDPLTALQTLFTSEQLKDVRGDAVIMERMGIESSSAVKKKGGAGATDKLDHVVPLELGGDNSEDNLKIVTEQEWKSYTPVENYLGKLLTADKIKEKEAARLIKEFKSGKMTFDQIKELLSLK